MREGSFHSLGSTLKLLALPSFNSVQWCYSLVYLHMIPIVYNFNFFFLMDKHSFIKMSTRVLKPSTRTRPNKSSAGPKLTALSYTSKRINAPIRIYSSGKPWSSHLWDPLTSPYLGFWNDGKKHTARYLYI